MCHFMSFFIVIKPRPDGERWTVRAPFSLTSHSDQYPHDGKYVECEWREDDPHNLYVRVGPDDEVSKEQYKAWLLVNYPRRIDLLNHFFATKKYNNEESLNIRSQVISGKIVFPPVIGWLMFDNTVIDRDCVLPYEVTRLSFYNMKVPRMTFPKVSNFIRIYYSVLAPDVEIPSTPETFAIYQSTMTSKQFKAITNRDPSYAAEHSVTIRDK